MWSVGSSATPSDLPDRLQALGMVPEDGRTAPQWTS
jgi:hypothetical protein